MVALGTTVPLSYAQRSVPVRAGIIIIDSARVSAASSEGTNFSPYVWYNLDSNTNVKPPSWNIYNPHAASTLTGDMLTRWTVISSIVGGSLPSSGTTLTKRDAGYWEVRLSSASDSSLADYDVLMLSAHGNTSLNPREREKLRRFVDRGGVLWVDVSSQSDINAPFGTQIDLLNGLPIPFSMANSNSSSSAYTVLEHPLLTYPNPISANTLTSCFHQGSLFAFQPADLTSSFSALIGIQQSLRLEFDRLYPVFYDANGAIFGVGRIGNGYLVYTSGGVANALNRAIVGGSSYSNQEARARLTGFDRLSTAAAKLVVNMIHLTSSSPEASQGTHRTNSNPLDVGAPLLKRFDAPVALTPGTNNYVPPTVYKGLLVVCDNDRVYVYSARPGADLDGNGNPDDGYGDYNLGSNNDLIWASQSLDGPISSATCIEVPGANVQDQILVQQRNGTVAAFNAFPKDAEGVLVGNLSTSPVYTVDPPDNASTVDTSVAGRGPYSPTFQEGLVFVADTESTSVGRVWVFDPATGDRIQSSGNDWVIGNALAPVMQPMGGPPTVGYIPIQDNSGGSDRVVYAITRPNPSVAGPNTTAGVTSLWFGARGEKPAQTPQIVSGNQLQITTRASQKGLRVYVPSGESRIGVKLTLLHSNGDPYSATEMDAIFTGGVSQIAPGVLQFELKSATSVDVDNVGFRLDYTIDWGASGVSNAAVRGNLFFPDDSDKTRRILHNLAMGPDGTLYAVTSNQQSGGSFFAFREEGQGSFRLLTRYDLYPQHTITLNQTDSVTYGETFFDKDHLDTQFLSSFLGGPFTNLSFQGGPAYRNGVVYVTARGTKSMGGFPVDEFTLLLSFRAVPEAVEINLPPIEGPFSISQPDMLRNSDLSAPTTLSTLQTGQYRYEVQTTQRASIRIDNLMSSTRGAMLNALSTSQPVIIRRPNQPDTLIEPDRSGGHWSPLLNYMVITGLKNSSPAFVTGNTVFVCGTSRVPNIVSGLPIFAPARGLIYAVSADISPTDAFLLSDSDRPWMNQLYQVKTYGSDLEPNPDVLWPQADGVMSFDDYRTRLLQTTLGYSSNPSTSGFGIIGGDNAVYAWSSDGVWAYDRADFVVCDEGRVGRFDGTGNPIWSTDTTYSGGPSIDSSNTTNSRPLVRPTRAYTVGLNNLVVVDPGANRVVQIDSTGREIRSIDSFTVDNAFIPEGYEAGETTNLREPRDVVVYKSYEANGTIPFTHAGDEYWIHYVIADSGNHRLIELVDRYTANIATGQVGGLVDDGVGVLYWHSPASFSGKDFNYNSVARTWVEDGSNSRFVYACGVGGAMPTRADTGLDVPDTTSLRQERSGNGGIVIFDGNNSEVINEVSTPAIGANVFWDLSSGGFSSDPVAAGTRPLRNLQSVTMRTVMINMGGSLEAKLAIMYTDASGVYEIVKNGTVWQVDWMLPKQAYLAMRRSSSNVLDLDSPMMFRPTYARRLNSGEVLVVNGYVGRKLNGNPFYGDIIQVVGDVESGIFGSSFTITKTNLGFGPTSIRFELPPVQGTRDIMLPVFADRR
jgi:hypothetical protein